MLSWSINPLRAWMCFVNVCMTSQTFAFTGMRQQRLMNKTCCIIHIASLPVVFPQALSPTLCALAMCVSYLDHCTYMTSLDPTFVHAPAFVCSNGTFHFFQVYFHFHNNLHACYKMKTKLRVAQRWLLFQIQSSLSLSPLSIHRYRCNCMCDAYTLLWYIICKVAMSYCTV